MPFTCSKIYVSLPPHCNNIVPNKQLALPNAPAVTRCMPQPSPIFFSPSPRSYVASTNNCGALRKKAPSYFEGYGLRVPLSRLGQKRLHAQSASELTSKGKKDLFNIAKDSTNGQASRLKNPFRSELALHIERVEILALGPHPKTTLPCKFNTLSRGECSACLLATKKEDLLEALGLNINALRAKCNKATREPPRPKSAPKKAPPHAEDRVIAQSILSFLANKHNVEQRSVPGQGMVGGAGVR
jgi:hypothetical protein